MTVSAMDTGWTRALSTSKFWLNRAPLHLWARLGSNQHVPPNAPSRRLPLSRCFAGVLSLARLVAYRVLSAPFGCSDGHRMDMETVSGVARDRLEPRQPPFHDSYATMRVADNKPGLVRA